MREIDLSDKAIDKVMEAQHNYVHLQHCIPNREFTRQWLNIEAINPIDDPDDYQDAYVVVPNTQTLSGKDETIYLDTVVVD